MKNPNESKKELSRCCFSSFSQSEQEFLHLCDFGVNTAFWMVLTVPSSFYLCLSKIFSVLCVSKHLLQRSVKG